MRIPKTLALFASSRRDGNTGRLIDRIARELAIEVVDLTRLRLSPYDYAHRNRDDDFEPLVLRALEHEQIIFATPVYWYAVCPAMKVFLDRLTDLLELPELLSAGRRLRGRRAYVVCTSASAEASSCFTGAFAETFAYLGMRCGAVTHVSCPDGSLPANHVEAALDFAARVRQAS